MYNVSTMQKKRIFIECTPTYFFGGRTGIPRVVLNIVRNTSRLEDARAECIPVVWKGGALVAIYPEDLKQGIWLIRFRAVLKKLLFLVRKRLGPEDVKRIQNEAVVPTRVRRLITSVFSLFTIIRHLGKKEVVFGPNDVLVFVDSSWNTPHWKKISQLQERGVKTVLLIYDLIAISHPTFFIPEMVLQFNTWLTTSLKTTDRYLFISHTVEKAFLEYAKQRRNCQTMRTDVLPLGADFPVSGTSDTVRAEIRTLFEAAPTYIAVSTIEPRKNHLYLLEAFDRLWKKGLKVQLLIIGNSGWMSADILEKLKTHKEFHKQLFIFHDISDTELDYAYTHSEALLYPSLIEGFGLPIIESLMRHKVTIVSNIPIHREVGGEYCIYLDLKQSSHLANIIEHHQKTGSLPPHKKPEDFTWTSWEQSAQAFVDRVLKLT